MTHGFKKIEKFLAMATPGVKFYRANHLAATCVTEIGDMVPQILQHPSGASLRWNNRLDLPKESNRELFNIIRDKLGQRGLEIEKERKAKQNAEMTGRAEALMAQYADLVGRFLDIAERKVSVLDEYGDERMHLLPKEVDECVAKIAGREGFSEIRVRQELKNRAIILARDVPKECQEIRSILPDIFARYHAEQQGNRKALEELASLSGVDFESAVARLLSQHGWHVSGTAATGDQGADIIASKGERRVIIQAKRYSGTVGNKAVQEVVGAISFYGGTEGCVVTNSTFTPAARALAQKNNIGLIDGHHFGEIAES